MEKALKMGKVLAIGSFQLFLGNAASTIIMAVGTVIFVRLISPYFVFARDLKRARTSTSKTLKTMLHYGETRAD